jgi:hypothetical protein
MSYGINNPFGGLIPKINLSGHADGNKVSFYRISPVLADGTANNIKIYAGDAVKLPVLGGNIGLSQNMGTIVPSLTQAAGAVATQKVTLPMGVFLGCNYTDLTGKSQYSKYFPGVSAIMPNTPIFAEVNDDPNLIFSVQISTSAALNIATPVADSADTVIFRDLPKIGAATGWTWIGKNATLGIGGIAFNIATTNLGYTNNPTEGDINKGSAYYLDGASILTANAADDNAVGYDVTILGLDNDELVQRKDPYQIPNNINQTPGVDMPFCRVICTWNKHYIGKKAGFVSTMYA